jgi:predicted small integral membrane protein
MTSWLWCRLNKKCSLRTTALEKLVYILVTMNETSILHLAGGKVTLQARRAVNQIKKPANSKFVYRDNLDFLIIFFLNLKFVINIDGQLCVKRCTHLRSKDFYALDK